MRSETTYRAARRNLARGSVWRGVKAKRPIYEPPMRLNRAAKWPPIKKYEDGPGGGNPRRAV